MRNLIVKIAREVLLSACVMAALLVPSAKAQDSPYFITYDHHLEEPGTLEVSFNPVIGNPKGGNKFAGSWAEFEYGAKAWWTTELYLDGQTTFGDGSIFTGWRWENRFRPLSGEHWINPVLYAEFEDINGADKALKEVVGFDSGRDVPANADSRTEKLREIETKLILSSNFKGWNVSENFIAEKNLAGAPWEFGYALGATRPLALAASPKECSFCPENFQAGVELYGGLGDAEHFTLSGTSHYLGPVVAWNMPGGLTLKVEPTWGLTSNSFPTLFRFGMSFEVPGFGGRLRRLFK
ncbi:MAG TPA: hypothetical protein VJX67_08650 [Blastocatellia bacterium]|nr:hypothetical protein [Blastocatellia bacterium]